MPILEDTRETLKLSIKSIKDSEVVLKDGLLAGDMDFVYGDATTNDVERALRVLSKMVVDWNLTDKKGVKLPITLENIKKLNINEVIELISQTSLGEAGKKKQEILKK